MRAGDFAPPCPVTTKHMDDMTERRSPSTGRAPRIPRKTAQGDEPNPYKDGGDAPAAILSAPSSAAAAPDGAAPVKKPRGRPKKTATEGASAVAVASLPAPPAAPEAAATVVAEPRRPREPRTPRVGAPDAQTDAQMDARLPDAPPVESRNRDARPARRSPAPSARGTASAAQVEMPLRSDAASPRSEPASSERVVHDDGRDRTAPAHDRSDPANDRTAPAAERGGERTADRHVERNAERTSERGPERNAERGTGDRNERRGRFQRRRGRGRNKGRDGVMDAGGEVAPVPQQAPRQERGPRPERQDRPPRNEQRHERGPRPDRQDRGNREDRPDRQERVETPGSSIVTAEATVTGWYDPARGDGGFIRKGSASYLPQPGDVFIPGWLARQFQLRRADLITAAWGHDQRKRPTVCEITSINEMAPDPNVRRNEFKSLTASYPNKRLTLETGRPAKAGHEITRRAIDLIAPIGYGQRALIVAPARAGKTTLLQAITEGVHLNHPDAILMLLLVDERPEEVSEAISWEVGEVIASSFDQPAQRHVDVTEIVTERAHRLVELGKDVVIVLDSITRMGRAFNTANRGTGRTMSGGLDANAMAKPKATSGT